MVTRTIGAGHAGPVEYEGDPGTVEGDIHQDLVERSIHERRVEGYHRMQATEGESGRARDRVLLGDSDVEHPLGILLGEPVQTGRAQHRGRDPDEPGVGIGELDDLVGEDARPRGARRGLDRFAGLGVDLTDRVELVRDVGDRRAVPVTLFGDHVHDDGSVEFLRLAHRRLEGGQVMAVHRAEVLDVEVGVQRLVVGEAREEAVHGAAGSPVDRPADPAEPVEDPLARAVETAVRAPRAHVVEETCHAADRRGVRPAVVVDDDHEPPGVVVADVVERLPGHAAGERSVADDRHDVSVTLTRHPEGSRDTVGPRQRARRVRASRRCRARSQSAVGTPRGRPVMRSRLKSWRPVSSLCT